MSLRGNHILAEKKLIRGYQVKILCDSKCIWQDGCSCGFISVMS